MYHFTPTDQTLPWFYHLIWANFFIFFSLAVPMVAFVSSFLDLWVTSVSVVSLCYPSGQTGTFLDHLSISKFSSILCFSGSWRVPSLDHSLISWVLYHFATTTDQTRPLFNHLSWANFFKFFSLAVPMVAFVSLFLDWSVTSVSVVSLFYHC